MHSIPSLHSFRWLAPLRYGPALALVWAAAGLGLPQACASEPLEPREALRTIHVKEGFRLEIVATEPEVMDPVALAFDENGRLYVVEMRGYPNEGTGEGDITSGRIKLLEDRDGDGRYETSTVFADHLAFPTGVCVWRGGVIVACAPDLLYFRDSDGDGRADERRVLYTGFGRDNIQQLVNSPQFEVDNWLYGANGGNTTEIRQPDHPDRPAVPLHGNFFRFRMPDGVFERMSGGGQYGLAADDFERWFTCSNARHLQHIVLPDHYLQRNPYFAAPAVLVDIPDHGAAARLFRLSPPEAWRVARTKMRAESAERSRFALTELVPAGYVTAACGNTIYRGGLFPEEYRGNSFVCDAANNVVHRDVLVPDGASFVARRAADEQESEFLASSDNWFRPVTAANGPGGALYVVDFYREVIETPRSLPDEIKNALDLERGHDRGRIYRIVPEDAGAIELPRLGERNGRELAELLVSPDAWTRLTAQRLLIERQDRDAVPELRRLAAAEPATARLHALWTLDGLGALDDALLVRALADPSAGVREHAIRLTEARLERSPQLAGRLPALADDPDPRVRFQLAFTLGELPGDAATGALARIARRDAADPWTRAALMSSVTGRAPRLLARLMAEAAGPAAAVADQRMRLIESLAEVVGAGRDDKAVAELLGMAGETGQSSETTRLALVDGLATGLKRSGGSLRQLLEHPPEGTQGAVARVAAIVKNGSAIALDPGRDVAQRVAALRLVGQGLSGSEAGKLATLLTPQTPQPVELAAVRALAGTPSPHVAPLLIAGWRSYGPPVRREVQEALFARADRLPYLLGAIESGEVQAGELDAARRDQLLNHRDPEVRRRAQALLASQVPADRQKVIDQYQDVLTLAGDPARGKAVFTKNCATCHRLHGEGIEVGADLTAVRTKTREMLLIDMLDPSRNMEPRFTNYVVATKSGQVLSGMIASETATGITLRRAETAEDTVLRADIDEIRSTGNSLMPDGLEKQLSHQELADLMEFVKQE